MPFPYRRLLSICIAALALCLVAPTALAEDEAGSVEEELKKQMDKILKLMKENEDALLELSSGGS